jgi:hypothetical protein
LLFGLLWLGLGFVDFTTGTNISLILGLSDVLRDLSELDLLCFYDFTVFGDLVDATKSFLVLLLVLEVFRF